MTRLVLVALLLAPPTVAQTSAQAAPMARCGPIADAVGRSLPEPGRSLYLKFCGV